MFDYALVLFGGAIEERLGGGFFVRDVILRGASGFEEAVSLAGGGDCGSLKGVSARLTWTGG